MPLDAIRWGILGCGDVTEVKSGPGVMNRGEESQVVAVMRRDAEKAADYAKRHGVAKWYDDADELINDPEVNAVYVATPPGGHRDFALKVAAAGKACYVEKPMARTADECREMVRAFREADRPLLVAYYRRRLPRFTTAKELIDTGRLGTVTGVDYVMARPHRPGKDHGWRTRPEVSGGGLFVDLGSHLLDLLDFLLGPLDARPRHRRRRAGRGPRRPELPPPRRRRRHRPLELRRRPRRRPNHDRGHGNATLTM